MTAQTPARRVSAARSKARTPKKVKGINPVALRRPDCLADADRTEPREASLGVKSLRVHPIDAERIDGFAERRHEIVQPFRSRHRCGRPPLDRVVSTRSTRVGWPVRSRNTC